VSLGNRTLQAYLQDVASSSPAPGAGSVAAVVGSLGCSLGEMVCGITLASLDLDREVARTQYHRLSLTRDALRAIRARLVALATDDETAYPRYLEARRLAKTTDEERETRRNAMREALVWAAEVPLRIAEGSAEALGLIQVVAEEGSKHASADTATAVHMLDASIHGALENVWVNLRLMRDPQSASALRTRAERAEAHRQSQASAIRETLSART
jgi:methenyltetrahydrofolate cyclohydrolase